MYQIVVIDRQRLQRQRGSLSPNYLSALKEALKYTLELDESVDEDVSR
jgi:mRNA interferase MazF